MPDPSFSAKISIALTVAFAVCAVLLGRGALLGAEATPVPLEAIQAAGSPVGAEYVPGIRERLLASREEGPGGGPLGLAGLLLAVVASCFLAARWELPSWSVALLWCVAAVFPPALPALGDAKLLICTLALVLVAVLVRVVMPGIGGALLPAAIWSFLPWWEPQLWILWISSFFWLMFLTHTGRVWMGVIFHLSLISGIVVLLFHGGLDRAPFVLNLPQGDLAVESLRFILLPATFFGAATIIGGLDAIHANSLATQRSCGGLIVLGLFASFFAADMTLVLAFCMTIALLCSSVWWLRMALLLPNIGYRVLWAVIFMASLQPVLDRGEHSVVPGGGNPETQRREVP